jgi:hypothetical protein
MSAQHRATPEQWATVGGWPTAECQCLLELRDRVLTMDACIRDIYEQLDRLNTLHESNWSRIVKLEEGPAVAEVRGPGSVTRACPQLATDEELDDVFYGIMDIERIQAVRAVYKLGLEHGAAIAKSQLADAEHV